MRDYEEKSYYEIQLDNKQLILVFLAAVTVCVLIFVLGVMIGKGQKEAEFVAASREEKKLAASEPDSNAPQQPLSDLASQARSEEKPPPAEPVSEKTSTVSKPQKEEAESAKKQETAKKEEKFAYEDLDKTEPAVAEKAEPVETAEETLSEEPKAGGSKYTVQVMATSSKPKAEAQITKLKSKGYKPFIDESRSGQNSVFKVRVGRFADTEEAKELASKIKTDFKLETWVAVLD